MANISPRARRMLKMEVAKAIQTTHRHRFINRDFQIAANSVTNYVLLLADDDPDYEVGGDGSTPAECEADAKIIDIDLRIQLLIASMAGATISYQLYRAEENAYPALSTLTELFSNDDSLANLNIRKNTLAYGAVLGASERDISSIRIRVRRKALKRAGKLHDTDRLYLGFHNTHASTAAEALLYGTITTVH